MKQQRLSLRPTPNLEGETRQAFYAAIIIFGELEQLGDTGATDEEIARALGWDIRLVRRLLGSLERTRYVRQAGKRYGEGGRLLTVWCYRPERLEEGNDEGAVAGGV